MGVRNYARLLGKYLAPHRAKVVWLALFLFTSTGLQLAIPQIIRSFIDAVTARAELSQLIQIALFFLGVALVVQLLSAASTYLSADVGWGATNALRVDVFRHVLSLDMRYHKERTPGELIERIDGDVTAISNFFAQFVVRVAGALLLIVGILVILWLEDWRVGAVMTVFVALVIYVLHLRREVAVPATQLEREANAQVFGFIEERLAGLDDIRANGAGRYVMHRFLDTQRDWYTKSLRAWTLRSTIWTTMIGMFTLGYLLTLGMGIGLFQAGAITLGTVYLFFNYMAMLETPLDQITQQLQEFQKAGAGIQRVSELLSEQRDVVDGRGSPLTHRAHKVEFRRVRFRYADAEESSPDLLKDMRFVLEAGQTMGLLGRTGSGKSTLIRLLFRLYDATEGQILLDGVNLRDTQLHNLRKRVGLVTQDVQLFHGSVRENLTFFDPSIADPQLHRVLEQLGLRDWLNSLPEGLDTILQSGGSGLSAGESQLLAFARVFLQDPGLVILDEPSSRLDPATERLLTSAIDRLLQGRTGIIIAHRLETVARVDKIMVLSGGEVLEYDDRAKLAADPKSRYHAMLQLSSDVGLDEQMEKLGV